MNKSTKALQVGIDVSYKKINVHCNGIDGEYSNNRKGWSKLLKDVPAGSVFSMEATGNYHYRLACFLHSKGYRVNVLNPLRVRRWVQSLSSGKATNDRIAARDIACFAICNEASIREWEPLGPEHSKAKAIVSIMAGLAKLEQAACSMAHAVSLVAGKSDVSLTTIKSVRALCGEHGDVLEAELLRIAGKLFPEKLRLLESIPGIGLKTAAVMLVCMDGREFETHGALSSFFGLVPYVKESGTSVKAKGKIVKAGKAYLRKILLMCAWTASRFNKPCRLLYERLLARGKPKGQAEVAVMHRLVKIAFGVLKSGESYRGGFAALKD